jgi:hypothetical protein
MKAGRMSGAVIVALLLISAWRVADLRESFSKPTTTVGLVFDPATVRDQGFVRDAYEAVLQEEGIPHRWISTRDLLLIKGGDLAKRYEALIFPDGLIQQMPSEIAARTREYLHSGGNIAVVLDPGVKDTAGAYRSGGVLAELVGIQYQRYRAKRGRAYLQGRLDFRSREETAAWGIPPGKLYNGQVVSGYSYGGLVYPMASAAVIRPGVVVHASFGNIPVLASRRVGSGRALWVNLPLGYLKAYGDDLPLRTVIRTFLIDMVKLPRLVPTPGGVGGLVVDWHVDSQIEWEGIPELIRAGIVRPGLRQQFDVTAGPYRDNPGDGLGFDACGRGRTYLKRLLPYGDVGSHGAWSHNWSSERLEEGQLSEEEFSELVARNNRCLREVTGRPVHTYSAPNGTHPQPMATSVLERLGIRAYYYTGDTGSAPTRTFHQGEMVSKRAWAFPVMPNGIYASIGEMVKSGQSPARVEDWLNGTLDYVVDERTTRLVYSHPYDLRAPAYRDAFSRFLDRAEKLQDEGTLRVDTMDHFARFMTRFVSTRFSFSRAGGDLHVDMSNDDGLEGLSFQIPQGWLAGGYEVPQDLEAGGPNDGYELFVVSSEARELSVSFPLAR